MMQCFHTVFLWRAARERGCGWVLVLAWDSMVQKIRGIGSSLSERNDASLFGRASQPHGPPVSQRRSPHRRQSGPA